MPTQSIARRSRRLAKDLGRRAYWGATTFLPKGERPYPFPGGSIYLDVTDSPAMLKRVLRMYERPKRKTLMGILRPGMTFIDVGANIGDFSLLAARAVGPAGSVLAVEPHPGNCELIRRSAALNKYRNINVYDAALSDQGGMVQLHLGDRGAWHTLVPDLPQRQAGTIEVRQMRLDDLPVERPFSGVIKIDVEGAEMSVLRGAYETLRTAEDVYLLLDLHPGLGVDPAEVGALLGELGFEFFDMNRHQPRAALLRNTGEVLAHKADH